MLLMEEAERIAKEEHGSHKIGVISGELTLCMLGNYTPRKFCLWWVYCFHVVRASLIS